VHYKLFLQKYMFFNKKQWILLSEFSKTLKKCVGITLKYFTIFDSLMAVKVEKIFYPVILQTI